MTWVTRHTKTVTFALGVERPVRSRTACINLLALIAALVAVFTTMTGGSVPAWSMDDGGGRSVFAYGAGNRALALGGAYAAVADDASAALWNPGGLGWVTRKQFQATHTNLVGFGFSEQYASFVLPSWRWGAASLTFRNFGVDGIEERNERNDLISDNLSDSEIEVALAYGHRIGRAWSIGGAVKMQRQSLAGFSDSGAGLDLGLIVHPVLAAGSESSFASSLTLGLMVRNVVEPTIRLDEESVPDPRGIRAGLAYAHPFGDRLAMLMTCDVEKTRDMDSRVHAGLELDFMSTLAMRVGLNTGTFTAGAGVVWRDVGLDYQFESNPIESVSRIGLSFTFGPTTDESHQAYLVAEEEELQAKLNRAFEQRNRTRIERILTQAKEAIAAGRYNEALEILAMVEVLSPGESDVRDLQAAAFRSRGLELEAAGDYAGAIVALGRALSLQPEDSETAEALARVRAASDRQAARTSEIRKMLDEALDAFAAGDLLTARTGFANVLAVQPDDREAEAMLRRTEEAIRLRAENLVKQARILAQAGQLEDAEETLRQARELDPAVKGYSSVVDLLAKIRLDHDAASRRREREASTAAIRTANQSAAPAAPAVSQPAPPQLTAAQRRELADLYRRGMTAIEQGRNDDAVRYWELVWSADPNYQRVAEYLKREYLARGMEAFAAGRLNDAVHDWEKVLEVDPHDQRALGYLDRAREQLTRIEEILDES